LQPPAIRLSSHKGLSLPRASLADAPSLQPTGCADMNTLFSLPQRTRVARHAATLFAALLACHAGADEAAIRKGLAERLPGMPTIDEIRPTAVAGLYEVRIGTRVLYADESGRHLIEGTVYDSQTRVDLTKARVEQLTAFDFKKLPLKDALVIQHGDGRRKVAVFSDPNCGHCKRLETELKAVDNVTVYLFALPVLGEGSLAKARDIWCAASPARHWQDWMLNAVPPPAAAKGCDSSNLERNLALGEKHRVEGTPTLVFEDSSRASGVLSSAALEQRLTQATTALR
jgi:thiol:disulfide interchange protein DsbC